jgi:Raf kinase inhibitor-like YbhB/YbcL family protein
MIATLPLAISIVLMSSDSEKPSSIQLTSPSFSMSGEIPKAFTGEGADKSPQLSWTGVPKGTKQWALICDDPDAPTPQPWVHWVIYNIPVNITSLPEAIPSTEFVKPISGSAHGKNSWGRVGYKGPMPPPGHGWHRYFFRIYALDSELSLKPGATKDELLKSMKGHILSEGALIGRYKRD